MTTECFFCKIANKEVPGNVIYENDEAVAILDIHPHAPGHTMVLPKVHAENLLVLPDDKIEGVFKAVKAATELLQKALAPEGFTIGINHGKVSGQTVDHLHVHVMPRWPNDGGGSVHGVVNNPPKESLEDIKKKIISYESTK